MAFPVVVASGVSPGAASFTCVVTKPVGLAVGHHMLGVIVFDDDVAALNDPDGLWALLPGYPQVITGTFKTQLNVYEKIADAADVAASTFTWTSDISTSNIGAIVATKDFHATTAIGASSVQVNAASSTVTASTITPLPMSLLFLIGCVGDNLTGSGYAIATNNPASWTEQVDINTIAGQDCCLQIAWANRPENTATGNGTYTVSLAGAGNIGALVAISPNFPPELYKSRLTISRTL